MNTESQNLSEWSTAVARELGLEGVLDSASNATTVDELATGVGDAVGSAAVPLTAFLVGAAAGRADDPAVAARDYAQKIAHLAGGWDSDKERGEPAADQSTRA